MLKRFVPCVLFILFAGIVMLAGCNTVKGAATGVGSTACGVAQDTQGLWQRIMHLDAWMKKNIW